MKVIPVLDILGDKVVRGVAGRRDEYRPIVTRLTTQAAPLLLAQAFREHFSLNMLYVADLDAILYGRAHHDLYAQLAADGFELLVDAGVSDADRAAQLLEGGVAAVVIGLETCPDPEQLRRCCRELGPDRLIFSLDMKEGRPLGDVTLWDTSDPGQIAIAALEAGVRRLIVLDLAQVGVGGGVGTTDLCRRLFDRYPESRLITGGGVRDRADLESLSRIGIEGVLVASALHDGKLTRADVESVAGDGEMGRS